SQCPK
ncbi:hypothetical protein D030_4446B, partial [Vibrio parahaemolyticus AQ3810]